MRADYVEVAENVEEVQNFLPTLIQEFKKWELFGVVEQFSNLVKEEKK